MFAGGVIVGVALTVTALEFVFVESATEVAVIFALVALAGAVYVVATPLAVDWGATEPQVAASHVTVQLTPLLLESLSTVAVTVVDWP